MKLSTPIAAALLALMFAAPAAAKRMRPPVHTVNVESRQVGSNPMASRLGNLLLQIELLELDGDVTEREARALRRDALKLTRALARATRRGMTPMKRRNLRRKLNGLERQITRASERPPAIRVRPPRSTPTVTMETKPRVANYGGARWDNVVDRERNTTAGQCISMCAANQSCTYAFHNSRGSLAIGHHHSPPDATINSAYRECVMFSGKPWWGSAPQSDGFIKRLNGQPAWEVRR